MQGGWDGERVWRDAGEHGFGVAVIGLQYRFGQFLDEQRNTVRALNDLRHHVRPQLFVSYKVSDDGGHLALAKPIEHHSRHLCLSGPRWSELRPGGDDEQHRNATDALDGPAQRLKAARIDPMRVLEDHQHRLFARQCFNLSIECFQHLLFALLRRERECRMAAIIGERQQPGKKGRIHS